MAEVLSPTAAYATLVDVVETGFSVAESQLSKKPGSKDPGNKSSVSKTISIDASIDLNATHLVSSPYLDFDNQLQLDHLDLPNQLLAFALTALKPIRDDYATAPYVESFNWSDVFALLRSLSNRVGYEWKQQDFYVVIFRSKVQANIDRNRLGLLDQMSHQEACASGGLLKYWFGSPDEERQNLATCVSNPFVRSARAMLTLSLGLWRNHDDAVAGGGGPWHKQARAAARVM